MHRSLRQNRLTRAERVADRETADAADQARLESRGNWIADNPEAYAEEQSALNASRDARLAIEAI